MPRVRVPIMVKFRLLAKMTKPMMSTLDHHRGAPDDGDIDLTDQIQHRQNGVAVTGALLVVGGAEHGHQDPQDNAQDQGQGGHQQGGLDAV